MDIACCRRLFAGNPAAHAAFAPRAWKGCLAAVILSHRRIGSRLIRKAFMRLKL
ncbi:hypothetical protein WCP94_003983 [Bilophila wadsworthia]